MSKNRGQTPIKTSAINNIAAHARIHWLAATFFSQNQIYQVTASRFATHPSERIKVNTQWNLYCMVHNIAKLAKTDLGRRLN